jgi:hypothetical protein
MVTAFDPNPVAIAGSKYAKPVSFETGSQFITEMP